MSTSLLVVLDVDSTLIGQEVVDLLADLAGVGAEVAAITESAMRGRLDFTASLTRRVALLEGLPESAFAEVGDRITVTEGVPELVAAVHAAGGAIAAVSGGFRQVLDPLAERIGLDRWHANDLEVVGGRLTGRVRGRVVDAEVKAERLRGWAAELGVAAYRTIAIGDGANDLRMMAAAALSIAYAAKPAVRAAADVVLPGPSMLPVVGLLRPPPGTGAVSRPGRSRRPSR